jgi:hypothetical protein
VCFERIRQDNAEIKLYDASNGTLSGIDKKEATILGIVELQLSIKGQLFDTIMPFAVIRAKDMPCCAVIGTIFFSTQ